MAIPYEVHTWRLSFLSTFFSWIILLNFIDYFRASLRLGLALWHPILKYLKYLISKIIIIIIKMFKKVKKRQN